MRFGSPLYLWLIVLVPAVAFLLWRALGWRRVLMGRFATEKVWDRLGFTKIGLIDWARLGLLILGLVFLVFALARPQWGYHERQVVTQGVDVVIAIDTSASMMARDFPPSRLTRAKELLQNIIWEARGDRVGIVAFAGNAAVMCPLTLDYNMAITALQAVDMNTVSARGTDIGSAIKAANGAFEVSGANDRVLVLLTDGEQLERLGELEVALQKAKEDGVRIFALGMGSTDGATIPTLRGPLRDRSGNVVDTRLDFELLQRLAKETGGQAIIAEKTGAAEVAQISAELSKYRGRKQQDKTFRVYHERYPWFVAVAMLTLLAEAFLRGYRPRNGRRVEPVRVTSWIAGAVLLGSVSGSAWAYPGEVYVRSRSGLQDYRAAKYDAAAEEYQQAAEIDPENPQLTYNLGAAAAKAGRTSEALSLLQGVYDPERPELNVNARYSATTLLHRDARKEIADDKAGWEMGLAEGRPESREAVQAMVDRLKEIIEEYKQVILQKPDDLDMKANFELARRDLEELEQMLEQHSQEEQEQQQQQEQPQQSEEEQEQQDDGENQPDESGQDEEQEGQEQDESDQGEQPENEPQDSDEAGENEESDSENEQEGEDSSDSGSEGQPETSETPGPEQTPSPQETPPPAPTPTPTPTPTPSPTPGQGQEQGGTGGEGTEPVPVGEMSMTDVDRLLNTLPEESQQALQLMMGAPTESQDMEHEW